MKQPGGSKYQRQFLTMKSNKRNIIYGVHPVIEAIEAGSPVDKIMVRKGNNHGRIGEMRNLARDKNIPFQVVPEEKIQRMVPDGIHQGVVAFIAAISYQPLEEIIITVTDRGETPFFIMLDGVTDVRNFGAIARTAECLGAHAVIVPTQGAAAGNADAIKVSAGALHHLPVCRVNNLVDAMLMLEAYGIETLACTEKSEQHIFGTDLTGPLCVIMGAEDKGISNPILKRATWLAGIPMKGKVSSLNVSVAAGILMAEVFRQRDH